MTSSPSWSRLGRRWQERIKVPTRSGQRRGTDCSTKATERHAAIPETGIGLGERRNGSRGRTEKHRGRLLESSIGIRSVSPTHLHALAAIEATAGIWPKTAVFLRAIADGAIRQFLTTFPIRSSLISRASACAHARRVCNHRGHLRLFLSGSVTQQPAPTFFHW